MLYVNLLAPLNSLLSLNINCLFSEKNSSIVALVSLLNVSICDGVLDIPTPSRDNESLVLNVPDTSVNRTVTIPELFELFVVIATNPLALP